MQGTRTGLGECCRNRLLGATMKNHKDEEIPFARGFATLDLGAWKEFEDFIAKNDNLEGYVFRGHKCDSFELVPTLVRRLREEGRTFDAKDLGQHLFRFRLAIRGRINLPERELLSASELWSIGRHHGLATPLLDWTASPLIASFFAFQEAINSGACDCNKRSIFALHAKQLNEIFFHRLRKRLSSDGDLLERLEKYLSFAEELPDYGRDDRVGIAAEQIAERLLPADVELYSTVTERIKTTELEVPRVISPLSGENARLVNQRGLFTKFLSSMSLEQWVESEFREEAKDLYAADHAMLLKVNIPNAERGKVLSSLDTANINYLSLFPDVDGAALFANSKL